MALHYYDQVEGRERMKRRYVWAFWSFNSGLLCGVLIAAMVYHGML